MAGDRNIKSEPGWVIGPMELQCSRSAFLDERERDIKMKDDARMCHLKRTAPGFETLMNMQYKKGGQ